MKIKNICKNIFFIIAYIITKTTINYLHIVYIDKNVITYKKLQVYYLYLEQFYRNTTITNLNFYLFTLFYENALYAYTHYKRRKS